ncbi:class I SAM-dependent methyltransferase [Nocardiopsis dassonvillei]|uniref:class I SAM-dependent methyltransferase n=1 Tax=Nocardiopsis dassonvillei TaxID=2014 RepID=UPI0008FC528C|nr:class I SAM-dependent methyltransferase [Nocardiopsis dassonvillei]APC35689.1 SAM-dependent methyltransferase [Nocardiopsis dassonvillei]
MVDRHFSQPDLAELYDYFNPWRGSPQDDFYLDLVMDARRVLDVGCGTGKLQRVARERGHTGRLVGLDPADAMLEVGRRDRDDVEWTLGDLRTRSFEGEFDLVVMTGHAFQVFLSDDEVREFLAAVRRALTADGRFVFETRNPAARGWEAWTPERVRTVDGPGGRKATCVHRLESVEGDLVAFTSDYGDEGWDEPRSSRSTLRFLDAETLNGFLTEAGFDVSAQYGYWDRGPLTDAGAEIITFARPR